jgi:hypothetical protein
MSAIVFGKSITCAMIAKRKCRDSEEPRNCEVIEYYKCFR